MNKKKPVDKKVTPSDKPKKELEAVFENEKLGRGILPEDYDFRRGIGCG